MPRPGSVIVRRHIRPIAAGALALALLALAACSSGGSSSLRGESGGLGSSAGATTSPATSSPVVQSPASTTPPPADVAHLSLALERVAGGLDHPVGVTNAGDGSGRLFVLEQPGRVRVVRSGRVISAPYLDVSSLVSYGGERGLLGIAFSPHFATDGRFYIDYTDTNGDTRIVRYTAADPSSDHPALRAEQLLHIGQPYANHNGGGLAFGPDGYLWIGMGDGGSAGDPGNRAQNPGVLLGKLLRIDVSGASRYAIPPGQPVHPGWAPEVWYRGLRNPWRFSFDANGPTLWIGDVGQDAWEEIDAVSPAKAGLNLGWPEWEGLHPYRSNPSRDGYTFPVYDYPHPDGESITGGYVYRASAYPALRGTYVYGDYVKGWIAALRITAPDGTPLKSAQSRVMLRNIGNPSSFGLDEAGELYVCEYGGTLYRVSASAR